MTKRFLILWLTTACSLCSYAQIIINDHSVHKATDTVPLLKAKALRFIVMGDWGRNGADHQKQVAEQMGIAASKLKTEFIISTGDNFYPSGVVSSSDPLFKYSFEDIYTAFSLQWDWYVVLGNHDYKSNPDAQVAYSSISRRWHMPARYFSKKFNILNDSNQVLVVFIDTNPLIPEFYSNKEYGPNVKQADSTAQKRWIEETLADTSRLVKWKIVVGHHPMYSAGGRTETYDTKAIRSTLEPLFDKYKVDAYLAGHEHSLQHLVGKKYTQHFISGAASERTPVHNIPECKMAASEYGFMLFSISPNELFQQTIDDRGKVIYTSLIKK